MARCNASPLFSCSRSRLAGRLPRRWHAWLAARIARLWLRTDARESGSRCATSSSPSRRWRQPNAMRCVRASCARPRASTETLRFGPGRMRRTSRSSAPAKAKAVRCRHRRGSRLDQGRAALRQLGTAEPVAGDEDADLDPVRAAGIARGRGLPATGARRRRRPRVTQVRAEASGVRQLLRSLREGGVVGIPPDQQPKSGDGEFAPFFGMPALTMTLFRAFGRAQRRDRGVRPVRTPAGGRRRVAAGVRRPRRARRRRRSPRPRPASACALNAAVERIAARDPAQYQWTYKRYTLRPSGTRRGQPLPRHRAPAALIQL